MTGISILAGDQKETGGILNKSNFPYLYLRIRVWCIKLIHKKIEIKNREEKQQGRNRKVKWKVDTRRYEKKSRNRKNKNRSKWKKYRNEIDVIQVKVS